MRIWWRLAGLTSAALALVSPAGATIYGQGTVSVAGGVPQDVPVVVSGAPLPIDRTLYLTVDVGSLLAASWNVDSTWGATWWEQIDQDQFVTNGNEYLLSTTIGSNDDQKMVFSAGRYVEAMSTLSPALATFRVTDHSNAFYICDDNPNVVPLGADCAEYLIDLHPSLDGFTVRSDRDFAWTLSDVNPAPEPAAWLLMLAGFGLAGAAVRKRRVLA